jgi:hypothetical protein
MEQLFRDPFHLPAKGPIFLQAAESYCNSISCWFVRVKYAAVFASGIDG